MFEGLFEIFFFLLGFGFVIYMAFSFSKPEQESSDIDGCPPHKWVYMNQEGVDYIVCSKCSKLPNQGDGERV
jgi:hypothetical protein